jgi:hypothetical protein
MSLQAFDQPFWNLDQGLLWIWPRDPEVVAAASNPSRSCWLTYNLGIEGEGVVGCNRRLVENEFVARLRSGNIRARVRIATPLGRGEFGEQEPDWFHDAEIHHGLDRASLIKGGNADRKYEIRVSSNEMRQLFPRPSKEGVDFTDRPDANPGEPFICLADAILWRVDVRSTESGKPPEEELWPPNRTSGPLMPKADSRYSDIVPGMRIRAKTSRATRSLACASRATMGNLHRIGGAMARAATAPRMSST